MILTIKTLYKMLIKLMGQLIKNPIYGILFVKIEIIHRLV